MSDLLGTRNPVSVREMADIEDSGVRLGISKLMMMENAGNAIARFIADFCEKRIRREGEDLPLEVLAFAGTGNNGGDVFVAVRHLAYYCKAFRLSLVLVGKKEDIRSDEARTNWEIIQKLPEIKKFEISDYELIRSTLQGLLSTSKAIVAGIFGTGFHGTPRELQAKVIEAINHQRSKGSSFCLSVDIPSGMEGDSGRFTSAILSDATITMHAPKLGILKPEARDCCGEIITANIGIPVC